MREEKYITEAQEREAGAKRLRIRPYELRVDARGGYVKEWLRQQFRNQFGGNHPPDWQVRTTVLPEVQDAAERAVANGLRRAGVRDLQAALVAMDVFTGDVLAMVGGRDFVSTPFNRAVRSRRQPGSAFKPFVFAAALAHGFSPVSMVTELGSLDVGEDEEWRPRNDTESRDDRQTLRAALIESNNRVAAALQQEVGTRTVLRLARSVGMRDLPDVPSLALGTGLVTPFDLTRAFAVFPNGGEAVAPRGLTSVVDADGDVAFSQDVVRTRVISPEVAYQVVSMLEDAVNRGTGHAVRAWGVRFPAGGKTGTTNEFKDAWFVGFSSAMVVGVWVGLDQPATMGRDAYGARLAAPIWAEFMKATARRYPPRDFTRPRGLEELVLCRVSYLKAVQGCPSYTEYFKRGDAQPDRLCPLHQGTFKQQAQRAIRGLWESILSRIFKR
jgi:penicillin-binding protein 1A